MKLGAIFIIAIMALAATGAGYALWSETLTITGTINTGEFKIGVRDDGTGDPGPSFAEGGLLYPPTTGLRPIALGNADPNYPPGDNSEGKNIASTRSINPVAYEYFEKDGKQYYTQIEEHVYNAYPWYASWIQITFANGGTVPAKIDSGAWVGKTGDYALIMPFLVPDDVYIYVDGAEHGPYDPELLEGFQYQLDPCHTISFKINFHFKEWHDFDGDAVEDPEELMPEGKDMGFTYEIVWAQWNEVSSGAPWIPT